MRGNLLIDNQGEGVDTRDATGDHTIENNKITGNGGGVQLVAMATLGGQTSELSGMSAPLVAQPSLMVSRASLTLENPHNGTTNPKSIPAAIVRYLVSVTNSGLGEVDACQFSTVRLLCRCTRGVQCSDRSLWWGMPPDSLGRMVRNIVRSDS